MRHRTTLVLAGFVLALAPAALAASDAGHHDHDGGARDAGPPETKEQKAFRHRYVADTLQKESALLKGLVRTPDVHKAASAHWRRAFAAIRIHELAEDDKDTATMTRAENFLRKIDAHFFAYLAELAPSLPPIPAAPTLTAPAKDADIAIGKPLTISMTPAAGNTPTEYYCVASQGGSHALIVHDPSTKKYSTSPTCNFAADDPRWAKFTPGKGGVWGMTLTKAKTAKGVEYNIWSRQAYLPVHFSGGAK